VRAALHALATGAAPDRAQAQSMIGKLSLSNGTLPLVIELSAVLGDVDTAFRLSDQFTPGYPMTGDTSFMFSPLTASMRNDRRFFVLVRRFGLAQFWRTTGRWPDFCESARMAECRKGAA
jgi:hypothetical protein